MCTFIKFNDNNGKLFYGRNLDVDQDYGEKAIITPRNYTYPMNFMDDLKTKYAIVGMGIHMNGMPLYFDCANEKGLVIGSLNFPGNAYFTDGPVDGKTNMTPVEFMTWVTGMFDNVKDVKEALKNLNLVNKPVDPKMGVAPLHWTISDANETIVVEQTVEGLHVYEDNIHVLTNNPEFPWHIQNLNNYIGLNHNDFLDTKWGDQEIKAFGVGTGSFGLPGDSTPPSRFVRAAYNLANYPTVEGENANVAKSFNIMKSVAMTEGAVVNKHENKELTIYTAVYSQATKTYYYDFYNDYHILSCQLTDENMNKDTLTIFD